MIIDFRPEAEADLDAAFAYYKDIRPDLASDLLDEFRRGIEQILRLPNAWPIVVSDYRQYRIHRFPCAIGYRQISETDIIRVLAFAHLKRNRSFWRNREK